MQEQEQLKAMKGHLKEQVEHHQREIDHHEEAIRRHREAMKKHKKGIDKLDEDSDWDRSCVLYPGLNCPLQFCYHSNDVMPCMQKHSLQILLMDVNVVSKFDWSLK